MARTPIMRVRGLLLIAAALAVIAGAAGYIALNYDRLTESASSVASPVEAPVVARDEETVTLKDFQSFQHLTADSLRAATDDIAAERADLKNLSDQVAALAARIDASQSTAAITPAPQPAAPAQPAAIAERKKPRVSKPAGRISVGGAPLPPARPDQ